MSVEVWLLFDDSLKTSTKILRLAARRGAIERGWTFQERPASQRKIKTSGRTRAILSPDDATHLYARLHRSRVCVLLAGHVWVATHPDFESACRNDLFVRVQSFCRYKGIVLRLNDQTTDSWPGFLDSWSNSVACEGERDPRCLPLHVFKSSQCELDSVEGRAAFDSKHGSGAQRSDDGARRWRLTPHSFHGTDQLQVAGCQLRAGCHWDVEPGGRSTTIVTTREIWRVDRYVNVYPDACVRGRAPHARKIS